MNCTALQKLLNPFHRSIEPGHKLQAYVCWLYKDTTPSVFKGDQVVKDGSFLVDTFTINTHSVEFRGSSEMLSFASDDPE